MTTIYTFAQSAIEDARSAGRYGTANLYTSAINSFRKFTGDIPLTFKELTAGLIKTYEESLLQQGRRHNTISAYMRMLRSIFNQAHLQGIPDQSHCRLCRQTVSFRFHRIRTHRQAGYFAHSHTAPLAIESGEAAQLTLQPRFVPAQFLSQRDSVRRPRPSPQNGHEIQHHSLPPA